MFHLFRSWIIHVKKRYRRRCSEVSRIGLYCLHRLKNGAILNRSKE